MERVTGHTFTNHTLLPKQDERTTAGKFDGGLAPCVNGRLPKGYGRSATYRLKQSEQRNTGRSYFVALIKGWPVK